MTAKPIISLRIGESVSLDDVAADEGLSVAELSDDIRSIMREHYQFFGTRGFNFEYTPNKGRSISANSNIGWLSGELVDIQIHPKIQGVDIGKCLGLSQAVANSPVSFNNKSKTSALITAEENYSASEYIAFSFIDSLYSVINNGIARKFDEVIARGANARGRILIQEWINSGKVPPPHMALIDASIDILPNQIISLAITRCIATCKSEKLLTGLKQCQLAFHEADPSGLDDIELNSVFLHKFNLPRSDYTRALAYSMAILRGCNIESGRGSFLPSVTVDLDRLFEDYVSVTLAQLMNDKLFEVQSQTEFSHDMSPSYRGKIKPDMVVRNLAEETRVVIDLKNKYSSLAESGEFNSSNSDIYQMSYYMNTLKSAHGLLVYPCGRTICPFPIKGSESESSYERKKMKFREQSRAMCRSLFPESTHEHSLRAYHVDLSGSMANTRRSVASLALLVENLTTSR